MAENAQERAESSDKTAELIHSRLEKLQNQRQDLAARLEQEMNLALAPLDASIKELTWMLAQLTGQEANPPEYRLFRREGAPVQQAPPQNVHQFQPARSGAGRSDGMPPPAEVVQSPKSGTPVPTNEAILRSKLQKRQ